MTTTTETMLEAQRALMRLHDRIEVDRRAQAGMEAMRLTEDEVLNLANICAKYRADHKGPQPRALISGIDKVIAEADRVIQTEHTARRKAEEQHNLDYLKGVIK
jgi:hypothetical protein